MNSVVTQVELDTQQIKFLCDLMMGCPLGYTKDHAAQHDVDDSGLYNHLQNCLQEALGELSDGRLTD